MYMAATVSGVRTALWSALTAAAIGLFVILVLAGFNADATAAAEGPKDKVTKPTNVDPPLTVPDHALPTVPEVTRPDPEPEPTPPPDPSPPPTLPEEPTPLPTTLPVVDPPDGGDPVGEQPPTDDPDTDQGRPAVGVSGSDSSSGGDSGSVVGGATRTGSGTGVGWRNSGTTATRTDRERSSLFAPFVGRDLLPNSDDADGRGASTARATRSSKQPVGPIPAAPSTAWFNAGAAAAPSSSRSSQERPGESALALGIIFAIGLEALREVVLYTRPLNGRSVQLHVERPR